MASNLIKGDFIVDCDPLANQKITTAEDAAPICDAIRNLKEIETLKLEGISLGIDAAKAISEAIAQSPTIKVSVRVVKLNINILI